MGGLWEPEGDPGELSHNPGRTLAGRCQEGEMAPFPSLLTPLLHGGGRRGEMEGLSRDLGAAGEFLAHQDQLQVLTGLFSWRCSFFLMSHSVGSQCAEKQRNPPCQAVLGAGLDQNGWVGCSPQLGGGSGRKGRMEEGLNRAAACAQERGPGFKGSTRRKAQCKKELSKSEAPVPPTPPCLRLSS